MRTWPLVVVGVAGALDEKLAERGLARAVGLQPPEAHRGPVRQHLLVQRPRAAGHAPAHTTYAKRKVQPERAAVGYEAGTRTSFWVAPRPVYQPPDRAIVPAGHGSA